MKYEDAITLLIAAKKSEAVALDNLKHARKEIDRATDMLRREIKLGETRMHGGYAITHIHKAGRRSVDHEKLIAAWEALPAKVRERFDTSFQGTVAELEELMGREDAALFTKLSVGSEIMDVKEVLEPPVEKPKKVDFRT